MRRFRPIGAPRVLQGPPPVSLYHREASAFSPLHHDLLGHAPMASLSTSWSDIKATTILAVRKGNRVVSVTTPPVPLECVHQRPLFWVLPFFFPGLALPPPPPPLCMPLPANSPSLFFSLFSFFPSHFVNPPWPPFFSLLLSPCSAPFLSPYPPRLPGGGG